MATRENNTAEADLPARLNQRFRPPLMAFFLRRLRDPAEAEDLTQETLLRLIKAHALTQLDHAEGYVFTTAANVLHDYYRKLQRFDPRRSIPIEEASESGLESQLVEALSPERVLLGEDSLNEVMSQLATLGELTREIFVLFRFEHMKQKDIAAAYGIGLSTVEKHLMRATMRLTSWQGGKKE
jgi:RNA polymerase sigma-70 factor (ECF subfamily)